MIKIDVRIKGVHYVLQPYKEFRDEWDLIVDGELVYDSKPYSRCLHKFLSLIGD